MKTNLTSFLFFCLYLLFINNLNAQVSDSLSYYSSLVYNPKEPDHLTKAYKFFTQKKLEYARTKKYKAEVYATQNLAVIQKKLGYYDESEKLNIESIQLIDLIKSEKDDPWVSSSKASTLIELAIIYRDKKDYEEAIKIYDRALKLTNLPTAKSMIQNNKGVVYLYKNELYKALDQYQLAYETAKESKDVKQIARSLDNLSFIRSKLSLPHAEEGLLEALDMRIKINFSYGIGTSYGHLILHYELQQDTLKAISYSDKYLKLAKETGISEQIRNALKLKIEIGDDTTAEEYIAINDSINSANNLARNKFNYYAYQYDKKEKDLKISNLRSERLLYLVIGSAFIFIAVYVILKYKHKKDKLEEIYKTETRISRKIHDEVANDVYHVMTKLQNENKDVLDDLEHIYNRTRDISKESSSIDLSMSYPELLNDLFLSYHNKQVAIITKDLYQINWDKISDLKKSTVYRVFQELLTNMKKHSNASIVVFNFSQGNKKISMRYKDNGIGSKIKKGNGLHNTENRIASINGTIIFDSEEGKGFKVIITI
ncbi:tetratricopeptide repeat protein [Nonlabens sp. Ci31]|jgi:signal transduction histidine kinase|uniref:tetratricopeptide repeat-containing sensor histidine kinase n=1 Tax=Nonlabens sp. Ci31 TaxID=2608253 RepID=UPI001463B922|nr:tetratricopeptide repeat-containing sensor histidine kinase [Nonlabens sp. Ci31]QJP35663.1 tetratricopeptide repeat protein [Nonlabens sp. Ci31]